jgi:formylglycine-generating enzyme required for sulfatase activity
MGWTRSKETKTAIMKPSPRLLGAAYALLLLGTANLERVRAQVIDSFSHNGELVASSLEPGTTATVEWASSVTGPWSEDWAGLKEVIVDSTGTLHVSVPMFYRVRGIPRNPNPERLAWIPPGTFMMGSPSSEPEREPFLQEYGIDETQHEVTLTEGFWMSRHEVTQQEYQEVAGMNPSAFAGENLPVENVNWYDADSYCQQLTQREQAAGRLPDGYVYRLPTEAEWEYACRAETTTAFHYGDELRSGMANFRGTVEYSVSAGGTVSNPSGVALEKTTTVGSYVPNAWGLYDMHGNVWEWCSDWIAPYPATPVTDPANTDPYFEVPAKVLRGGSWKGQGGAMSCRSAHRGFWVPESNNNGAGNYGFRVVLARPVQ